MKATTGSLSLGAYEVLGRCVFAFATAFFAEGHALAEGMGTMKIGADAASSVPDHSMGMRMMGPVGIPISREGSGTAWQPDSTPMAAIHANVGDWRLMFHENVFAGYDAQSSTRGDGRFFSTNWLMGMARHDVGPGEFSARVMLSLEGFTVGGQGYPLLLQTGETWKGAPLHDHQHPHDLFMETALEYVLPVSSEVGLQLYVAPVGEPALGPVAFPHRASARSDPLGTLGHHWQDSTHISFGVLTAGVFSRYAKLEGSWFNGREPDENRYDFDLRAPDSFAARLSVNPTAAISAQASWGYLKSPESLHPNDSLHRLTASLAWNTPVFGDGNWASAAIVGVNLPKAEKATQSSLLETNLDLNRHHTVFSRLEVATKTGADLVLPMEKADTIYPIGAISAGYLYSFHAIAKLVPAVGVRGSLNVIGSELGSFYGSRTPVGAALYVQVRPESMRMGGMQM